MGHVSSEEQYECVIFKDMVGLFSSMYRLRPICLSFSVFSWGFLFGTIGRATEPLW